MAPPVIPYVGLYTGDVPSRENDSQSEFNTNVNNFLNYVDELGPDLNDTVTNMNLAIAATNVNTATASAAADTAIAAASATLWNSTTTYDEGDVVISDGEAFIAVESNTNDYPNTSVTGKWNPITTNTQNVIDRISNRINLLWNPDFTVNQEVLLTASPGNYGPDFWFVPNEESSSSKFVHISGAKIEFGDIVGGYEGVWAQFILRRTFDKDGTIQIGGIFEDDWLTISADVDSGYTLDVYTGYGTSSGSNLTTTKAGTLTSTNREVKFQVDYNGSLTNYLAIKLVPTGSPAEAVIKNLKLNTGQKATPYEQPNQEQQLKEANRWLFRSYDDGVATGAITDVGVKYFKNTTGTAQYFNYHLEGSCGGHMRAQPTVTIYSPNSGNAGYVYDTNTPGDIAVASVGGLGETGFTRLELSATLAVGYVAKFHYVIDARP